MKKSISRRKHSAKTLVALTLFAVMLLVSFMTLAATTHTFSLTAKILPNGQLGYALNDADAVIPGPTLFVQAGDTIHVELTNKTTIPVSFKVPGVGDQTPAHTQPNQTGSYSFIAAKAGSYVYHGNNGKELLGLFGGLIVDNTDGPVDRYVGEDGTLIPVNKADLSKQFILFMVGSTFWATETSGDGTLQTPLWANPTLGAEEGDIVRFHVMSIGPAHTYHLHAHRWLKPGTDEIIDTKLLAEGTDTHSYTIQAGVGVGPGDWQFHCHLIAHMEAGMHGSFRVGGNGASIVGASPYGRILLGNNEGHGLVTFEISDEPASWFKSTRGDAIVNLGLDIRTKSLEVIAPGSSVNFIMSDTHGVHTISSLLWPTGAAHMPFDQSSAYRGGGIIKLDTPGLYVFTCKVHPYMFGAVIVDGNETDGVTLADGLDLGNPLTGHTIDLVTGIHGLPTSSDLAVRLLRTFFIATAPENWQDYTTGSWNVKFPKLVANISGASIPLDALNISMPLAAPVPPKGNTGVGEVWINTQFEKTANKSKPGTVTVLDTSTWTLKRKIALPEINMNNPHNLWPNRNHTVIYQTQWFDDKLTMINQATGEMIPEGNIRVGDSPSHVMTLPSNDDITVAINGENGIAIIPAGTKAVNKIMPTQAAGHTSANPHGHWVSADGKTIVTPNINTNDIGRYDAKGEIISRTATGNNAPGAHPIAIGMMPDSSKIYASNLLHHSVSVINGGTGKLEKTINLIADYNPITGAIEDFDGDGVTAVGVLPIQIPVSPDGKVAVVAATGGQILIIDTATDKVVKMIECDPGCHGANFGAKQGGGYYAYVTSKFSNRLLVVNTDPNGDGDLSDAAIVGSISMVAGAEVAKDDTISGLAGFGGQGLVALPNVYNGWVQNLSSEWSTGLTDSQRNPIQ
jgi:DNA-binding beta-propeller fold protein YncE/plastocyanin